MTVFVHEPPLPAVSLPNSPSPTNAYLLLIVRHGPKGNISATETALIFSWPHSRIRLAKLTNHSARN